MVFFVLMTWWQGRLVWLTSLSQSWRQVVQLIPFRNNFSPLPGWLFLPAHTLQGGTAASYMHSCYTEMHQSVQAWKKKTKQGTQVRNTCSSLCNTRSMSRRLKNSLRWWLQIVFQDVIHGLLTSRRCSCPVLSCAPWFSGWETGWEWGPGPRRNLKQPRSPARCTPACRTFPHSPSQTTYKHQERG